MSELYLPADDDFAEGATAYGTGLAMYLRLQPWTTNPETVTGYSIDVGHGDLFDGYIGAAGNTGTLGAAFHRHSTLPDDDQIVWAMHRSTYLDDASIQINPRVHFVSGSETEDSVRGCGVCGRVSGGSILTPAGGNASDEYHSDVDGYFFIQVKQGLALQPILLLLRVVAGVPTVLNSRLVSTIPGALQSDADHPQRMRMEIETIDASTVRLTCWRRRWATTGVLWETNSLQSGSFEDRIFQYNDTNAARITTEGRWGFGAQVFRSPGGGQRVGILIDRVEVKELTGDTVVLIDDFARWDQRGARAVQDALLISGRSLMQSFTGDAHGDQTATAFPHWMQMLADAGNDRIVLGADVSATYGTGQLYGYMISQRPASSVQQRRSVDFTVINVVGETVRAGIMLRATFRPQPAGPDYRARFTLNGSFSDYRKVAYHALVVYEAAGSPAWLLEVRQYREIVGLQSYASTLLATVDLTAAGLAVGTAFTLDFEVRNFDSGPFGNGSTPALRVKVDTVVQTPVAEAVTGVLVVDDWIIDQRSEAVQDGLGEGFSFDTSAFNASGLLRVENWAEQALSDPPQIPLGEQESIPLESEIQHLAETLTVNESLPITVTVALPATESRSELGYRQAFPAYSKARRTWSVRVESMNATERLALTQFWDRHKGPEIPFNWIHPTTGEAIRAKFVEDSLEHGLVSPAATDKLETASFSLVEVFPPTTYNGETTASVEYFKESSEPGDGGGAIIYPGEMVGDPYWPVFHLEDTANPFDVWIVLSQATVNNETVNFTVGGTAVDGTHFTISPASAVTFFPGQTRKAVTITPIESGIYHEEVYVSLTLADTGSTEIDTDRDEVHAYIRTTTAPPDIGWESSSPATGSIGLGTVTLTVELATPVPTRADNVEVWIEQTNAGDANAAVEGTDFEFVTDPNGGITIGTGATTATLDLTILPGATITREIELTLVHELNDGSEANWWTFTDGWQFDYIDTEANPVMGGLGSAKFPREPGNLNPGPANNEPPNPYETITDGTKTTPWGEPIEGFEQRSVSIGKGYIRKNSEVHTRCGQPVGTSLIPMPEWQRFSVYVDVPTSGTATRLTRVGFRERGATYDAQPFGIPNPGGTNYGAVFDRSHPGPTDFNGDAPVSFGGDTWGVDDVLAQDQDNNPVTLATGSEAGITVETIRTGSGTTQDVLRLWFIVHEDDVLKVGNQQNVICRPVEDDHPGSIGDRILYFWPMWEHGDTALSGPPGRFWPRKGLQWEPRGRATTDAAGVNVHTVEIVA